MAASSSSRGDAPSTESVPLSAAASSAGTTKSTRQGTRVNRDTAMALVLRIVFLALASLLTLTPACGEEAISLDFFWGRMCSHCEEAQKFLTELQKRYPRLAVTDY